MPEVYPSFVLTPLDVIEHGLQSGVVEKQCGVAATVLRLRIRTSGSPSFAVLLFWSRSCCNVHYEHL